MNCAKPQDMRLLLMMHEYASRCHNLSAKESQNKGNQQWTKSLPDYNLKENPFTDVKNGSCCWAFVDSVD